MKRKTKATLFIILIAPLIIGIPILMNFTFPKILLYYSKISFWFVIASLITIIMPIGQYRIGGNQAQPNLSIWVWLLLMSLLFLISNLLHLTLSSSALQLTNLIHPIHDQRQSLLNISNQLFLKGSLFPWSMVAITVATLVLRSQQHSFSPFSQFIHKLHKSAPTYHRFISKTINMYIEIANKIFIITTITIFTITLFNTTISPHITILFSTINFFLLWLVMCMDYFKKMEDITDQRQTRVALKIVMMMIITLLVMLATSVVFKFALKHADYHQRLLLQAQPTKMKIKQSWQSLWYLWSWSWWIMATPFIASLIIKLSHGRTIRATIIVTTFLIPCLSAILFVPINKHHLITILIHWLLIPKINLLFFSVCMIALLFILASKSSHNALWLGFYPITIPKKTRIVPYKQLWLLNMGFITMLLIHGIEGLVIIQTFLSIPCFAILLLSIVYYRHNNDVSRN